MVFKRLYFYQKWFLTIIWPHCPPTPSISPGLQFGQNILLNDRSSKPLTWLPLKYGGFLCGFLLYMASQAQDIGSSGKETPLKVYVHGYSPQAQFVVFAVSTSCSFRCHVYNTVFAFYELLLFHQSLLDRLMKLLLRSVRHSRIGLRP